MRAEATLEEWARLYETATRIRELEPWELLWDMDIIGIQVGKEPENTVFYSILGKGGECYGIAAYEGYEGFNSFLMLTMHEKMNLSIEYAMFHQRNLTCYWGNRDELSAKQREIIKNLGYKYRGKNNWLYFQSYEPGYYPYNLDQAEVLRMTEHLEDLERAFTYYREAGVQVDFESGNMFSFIYSADRKTWHFGEKPLPFTGYNFGNLIITDEELLEELSNAPKGAFSLEADVRPLGAPVSDKKYNKPANPAMSILTEANTGMIISCDMNDLDEDAAVRLAESVIGFIFKAGAPKEIKVSNVVVEAALEQICEVCNIRLRRVKRLKGMDEFWMMTKRYW
ncbi:DUF7309 domain-containing protein [Clostridium transplantifaecale]|uniref:DUF7309 domain-containing protein n=1 Tax=Clostridium transplantifaecale TaxID=2479838 RepID=UPI000F640F56|nr:hypothetical protein [Clostridium transplantifaecale]